MLMTALTFCGYKFRSNCCSLENRIWQKSIWKINKEDNALLVLMQDILLILKLQQLQQVTSPCIWLQMYDLYYRVFNIMETSINETNLIKSSVTTPITEYVIYATIYVFWLFPRHQYLSVNIHLNRSIITQYCITLIAIVAPISILL